jgi:putative transposase
MKLKALEQENNNLKRLLAEKELEIQTLTNIIKKTSDTTVSRGNH